MMTIGNMIGWVRYISYVIQHKRFVLAAGRELGVPLWRLILHDWDKFTPGMMRAYKRTFRGPHGEKQYKPTIEFDIAWNGHEKRNKHHWQYWILIKDSGEVVPLPMPDVHRREMLADWRGAGRALGMPDTRAWYLKNREAINLHPDTRAWVERELRVIGDDILEALAENQHEIWSHWMGYLFAACEMVEPKPDDGTAVIPARLVERWTLQLNTPYSELNSFEQDSDREIAERVVEVLYRTLWR